MPSRQDQPSLLAEAGLEPERVRRVVADALIAADDGELFVERRHGESLVLEDGRLRLASRDAREGFGLRAVSGERVGLATSTALDEAALGRAAATVRAVARGHGGRENLPLARPARRLYPEGDPLDGSGLAERLALLREIDAHCRAAGDDVRQVTVSLACAHQAIEVLRGDGRRVVDRRPLVRLAVQVVVERAGRRESGGDGAGGRMSLKELLAGTGWRQVADRALSRARLGLEAVPAPAGEMTVVLGPGWPGVMLHEAVGHGLEGDFNRKGISAFAGLMGERVAAPGVSVVDDGTLALRRGSLTVDDEGTPGACTVLIEDGILKGYMQDRQSARLMRTAATGNGRRESFAHTVMPRMTNTYMLAGTEPPEAILAGVGRGLYAVHFGGGQVDITSGRFVFAAAEAYLVEGGRITAPVKGATLIGNGPEALLRVTAIGNDLALDQGVGTCGKNGQAVPVGVGQPTLRLERMTVGGTAR